MVTATGKFDAALSTYTLEFTQHTPATPGQSRKLPLHIPLAVGLVGPDGRDLPLRQDGEAAAGAGTRVLHLREAAQSFRFIDVPTKPVPSLLRGFSAPVALRFDHTDAELAFLVAHDSDPVNRWDAAQCSFVRPYRRSPAIGATPAFSSCRARWWRLSGRFLSIPGDLP